MAKSATLGQLNPASVPFFPGLRASEDGAHFLRHELDRSSDYFSSKSSPSPPSDDHLGHPLIPDDDRSPTFRSFDANKSYPAIENRIAREASMLGSLESLPESEDNQDTPGPVPSHLQYTSSFKLQQASTPPVAVNHNGSSYSNTGALTSSPVSSSGSLFTPSHDLQALSFEAQLKASPVIHEILDRLVRCEYSTREIQRDLADVQRKVNLLVERSLGTSKPEFKDPFATGNGSSFSNGPRPSLGNIAPNQAAPADDVTTISQRLNTLTSSVGQLLALQTQHIQSSSGLPVEMTSPHMMSNNQSILGHGLPTRSGPRVSNPPMRTWSAGTLDLPLRQPDSVARQEAIPRDKRRSVSGLLRRDSSGVCFCPK